MKIATWNVNGIRARHEQVAAYVAEQQPEVLCLQEIKALSTQVPSALSALEGYHCYWHGGKGYSGVALLVHHSIAAEPPLFAHPPFDHENRIVTTVVKGVTVASVYVPNGGKSLPVKLEFLRALVEMAQAYRESGDPLVICGDINVAHREMDVHPKERGEMTGQSPIERGLIGSLLQAGLVDLGRQSAPDDEALFTWWAPWRGLRKRNIGWRIDYLLASEALAQKCETCRVDASFGTSDHAPVQAVLEL